MHGFQDGSLDSDSKRVGALEAEYETYRSGLLAAIKDAPGSILLSVSHGWSSTSVLAGVPCRLPKATLLVHEQAGASTVDMVLLVASLKGQAHKLEQHLKKRCPEGVAELCERIAMAYAAHDTPDFQQVQSLGVR